ncbi:hypothetical protein BTHERMOSOX_280 [Bathymodiolus thermophilus thioautotrophic gill symbiont]|nr:hypothetical protein BTHERMOSOX_280 [Bathymodiolus thermophilus thioautotrophic gill symbiont]
MVLDFGLLFLDFLNSLKHSEVVYLTNDKSKFSHLMETFA